MASDRWTLRSLYSIASYINGRATKSSEVVGDGVPVIKIAELNRGITSQTARVDASVIEDRHWVVDGDLLFAWSGTVGVHIYRGERAALNQHIFRVVAGDGVDQRFLRYLLQAQLPTFKRYVAAKRTTMGHVTVRDLRETNVLVPPTSEQHAIASVLGALDDKIESNRRLGRLGREVLTVDYARRSAAASEDAELHMLVSELRRGVSPKYTDESAGVLVLNQRCIRDHEVRFEFARRHDESRRMVVGREVYVGDILVNSTGVGTLGRVAPIEWLPEARVVVDSHVTVVRADPDAVEPLWLASALLASEEQIVALGEGSTGQTELSRRRLGSLVVRLPRRQTQVEHACLARAVVEQRAALARESRTLAAIRDALLPKLVSGQIRVPLSNDSEEMVGAAVEALEANGCDLGGQDQAAAK